MTKELRCNVRHEALNWDCLKMDVRNCDKHEEDLYEVAAPHPPPGSIRRYAAIPSELRRAMRRLYKQSHSLSQLVRIAKPFANYDGHRGNGT